MIRKFKVAAIATLATLSLIATPLVSAQQDTSFYPEPQRTITTTGTGIVTVEPDMATFSVAMEARNEELKVAQNQVTDESNAITEMLLERGVAEEDIVTSSYEVTPENKYDFNGNFVRIEHYVVRLSITITVHDIELVGELLDETVTLGADFVSKINFSVSNPDPHIQEARKAAIADARLKAEDYAVGSDSKLTGLFSLYESSSPQPMARESEAAAPMMDSAADVDMASSEANPVDVSAGTSTIIVKVETTWTIEPNVDGMIEPESTPAN